MDDQYASPPLSAAPTCSLVGPTFTRRREEIRTEPFAAADWVENLSNGIAVRFADAEHWADRALTFISFERTCCPFLGFDLMLEPFGGPDWRHARGSDPVAKALILTERADGGSSIAFIFGAPPPLPRVTCLRPLVQ